jgi:coenzyme F420-reducing hydrogenase delta subunit
MGLEAERLKFGYCTAAEGQKFQREATEFDKLIRSLGPSPLKSKSDTPKKVKT